MMDNILDEHLVDRDGLSHQVFSMYRQFELEEDLQHALSILREHRIPYKAKANQAMLDSVIIGQGLSYKFWVEIPGGCFGEANRLLLQDAQSHYGEVDIAGHHLNGMSDAELREILVKPDEWSPDAVAVAGRILEHRGVAVSQEEVEREIQARNEALKKPRKGNPVAMGGWFIVAILSGYFLVGIGVLAAAGMGVYYAFYKKTTPDGGKHYEFDAPTRKWGQALLFVTLIMAVVRIGRYFY